MPPTCISSPHAWQPLLTCSAPSWGPPPASPPPPLPPRSLFETWLVLEWCDRGSLAEFITTKKLPPTGSDPQQREAWILLCLLDIALGLNYLHSSGIVSMQAGGCRYWS